MRKISSSMYIIQRANLHFPLTTEESIYISVLTDNAFVYQGIVAMVADAGLKGNIELTRYSLRTGSSFLPGSDLFLVDEEMNRGLGLLTGHGLPSGRYSGCSIQLCDFHDMLLALFRGENTQLCWYRAPKNRLSWEEAELCGYLAAGLSVKMILKYSPMTEKSISRYKQQVKKKLNCRSDMELFRSIALAKNVWAGEKFIPADAGLYMVPGLYQMRG